MSYTDRTDKFVADLGAEAHRVGGSVRDEKLGRRVKDADYVIRMERKALGTALRKTGAEVGPLALRDGQHVGFRAVKRGLGAIEIVIPRIERKVPPKVGAGNERHNFEIIVDPSVPLAEDAIRRDFTINAIYRNAATGEITDPLDGLADLEARVIRTTHERSFRDDPLRILRALRFVAVLPGFDLTDETRHQMMIHSDAVTGLTGKGVSGTALDELSKILMGRDVAKALRIARDTDVLATLLPELHEMIGFEQPNEHHDLTVDEHTFVALDAAAAMGCSLRVRLALLFHDSGKPEVAWMGEDGFMHFYENKNVAGSMDHAVASARRARKALIRLNAPNDLRRDVPLLVERHMVSLSMRVKATKVRTWRCDLGDELLSDLLKHRLADCMGKSVVDYDSLRAIARMEHIREEAEHAGVPKSPKDLKDAGLIDGTDLIEMGVRGPDIGRILGTLLHEVVSQPERAQRDWLLGRAKRLAGLR